MNVIAMAIIVPCVWRAMNDHSNAGVFGRSGSAGRRPVAYAHVSRQEATKKSKTVSASRLDVSAGTLDPGTRLQTVAILTTSPPRAGANALMPTPATYAPSTVRQPILSRGKAALMIACHAFVRSSRFAECSASAIMSASRLTSDRWSTKVAAASKKLRMDSISRSGA
jgi:hypothetical protein